MRLLRVLRFGTRLTQALRANCVLNVNADGRSPEASKKTETLLSRLVSLVIANLTVLIDTIKIYVLAIDSGKL